MLDSNSNKNTNSNARVTQSPKNFNSNSDFSLADKLNDDFESKNFFQLSNLFEILLKYIARINVIV